MEVKDYLALSFSLCALLISAFTLYRNFLRGSKYRKIPIHFIEFSYTPDGMRQLINLPIVITNIGGKTGVIYGFSIKLIRIREKEEVISFTQLGEKVSEKTVKRIQPFAVKPAESYLKDYIFEAENLWNSYEKGRYEFQIYCHSESGVRLLTTQKICFKELPTKDGSLIVYGSTLIPQKVLEVAAMRKNGVDVHELKALFCGYETQ